MRGVKTPLCKEVSEIQKILVATVSGSGSHAAHNFLEWLGTRPQQLFVILLLIISATHMRPAHTDGANQVQGKGKTHQHPPADQHQLHELWDTPSGR